MRGGREESDTGFEGEITSTESESTLTNLTKTTLQQTPFRYDCVAFPQDHIHSLSEACGWPQV